MNALDFDYVPMPPTEFLVGVLGFSLNEAKAIIGNMAKITEADQLVPPRPPCAIATDSGERDDALSRVLSLIRGPGERLRIVLS